MIGMSSRYLTEKAPHHYNMIISKFTIRHKPQQSPNEK